MALVLPLSIVTFAVWQAIKINRKPKPVVEAPIELAEAPVNVQDTLTLGLVSLRNLNYAGIQFGLFHRGLYHHDDAGNRVPHMVRKVPSMTNELVSFLPNGGMTVRWELKPNLLWGDSVPITPEDLVFSLNMNEDPNRDSITILENGVEILYKKRLNNVLNKFAIYPQHQYQAVFDSGGMDSVSWVMQHTPPPMDGPYVLDTFVEKDYALFRINPFFPGPKPHIPFIRIQTIPKGVSTPDWAAQDGFDCMVNVSSASYEGCKPYPAYAFRTEPSPRLAYFYPDLNVAPYNILEVRQALAYGIDREKLNENLDGGAGVPAMSYTSSIAEDAWGLVILPMDTILPVRVRHSEKLDFPAGCLSKSRALTGVATIPRPKHSGE